MTFTCVGRLCPQKGQLVLLDAFAELRKEGRGAKLVLAGDGEMRPEVEARIHELGQPPTPKECAEQSLELIGKLVFVRGRFYQWMLQILKPPRGRERSGDLRKGSQLFPYYR